MDLRELDAAFAATRGVFTMAMLRSWGLSARTARRVLERGDIKRVCGNAFIRRGRPVSTHERAIGARLTWPDAIICFVTAAVLHGLALVDDGVVHVLVPSPRRAVIGIQAHHWSVRPTEVIRSGVLVVTDRRTTLADCLGRMPNDDAWGLLAWSFTREQIAADDVASQIAERHHLHGVVRLRQMTAALRRSAVSLPEVQLQEFLEQHGIVGWKGNFTIRRRGRPVASADIGFETARLVIEYDGAIAHGPAQVAADARRDALTRSLGYEVLRVRWVPFHEHRGLLRDTIRAVLREPDRERRRTLALAWNEHRFLDLERHLTPSPPPEAGVGGGSSMKPG